MGKIKAICLFSGGLDSILAVKVLEKQGVDVLAVKFVSPFFGRSYLSDPTPLIKEIKEKWQINLFTFDITREYLLMLKAPRYGYGKNFNPCIDCKILMVKKAGELMKKTGAMFIATGEVIGQRPMSQRRETMRIVERDSGMEGYLLRPLSAKLLPETLPEKEGMVDRQQLLDISGRSRIRQMALAESMGITEYPSPAGGCVLTDPILSKRIEYVVRTRDQIGIEDIDLCHIGRHFVWPERSHLIVGRNQSENERMLPLAKKGYLLKVMRYSGPIGLFSVPRFSEKRMVDASGIVARYGKGKSEKKVDVLVKDLNSGRETLIEGVAPCWNVEALGCKRL